MGRSAFLWVAAFAVALFAVGCGVKPTCGPQNCEGCCDTNGLCRAGNVDNECGASGVACFGCSGAAHCLVGACVTGQGPRPDSGSNQGSDGGPGSDAGPTNDAGPGADGGPGTDGGPVDAGGCGPGNCAGCCAGNFCVAVTQEGPNQCGLSGVACGSCGGLRCLSGVCEGTDAGTCGPGNCDGCCAGGTCVHPAAESDMQCGSGGQACTGCFGFTSCQSGQCAGCLIAGVAYSAGQANPSNPCQSCNPISSKSAWTPVNNGTACGVQQLCIAGACLSGCDIGGVAYASGAANPNDLCQVCSPSSSMSQWTNLPNGTSCGNGQLCLSGVCGQDCNIAGTVYASGALNPANACQICQPGTSTTAWTARAQGTVCGAQNVCNQGACQAGCYINGNVYNPGTANPAQECQTCDPSRSLSQWSSLADGTACAGGFPGYVCEAGTCQVGCVIAGVFYADGAPDPANACLACSASLNANAWSNADGVPCGAGRVCYQASCQSGCYTASGFFAPDAGDPANACEKCVPAQSTTAWTPLPNGTSCGAPGNTCEAGTCSYGCIIAGTFYAQGAWNPSNTCQGCAPRTSTSAWSPVGLAKPSVFGIDGGSPYFVVASDFNADGRPDVALIQASDTYSVMMDGPGGFLGPQVSPSVGGGSMLWSLAAGDLNGDGRPDLVSGDYSGNRVVVSLNAGGSFATWTGYDAGNGPNSVAIADFDGDGRPDVAVANLGDNGVALLRNLGGGVLGPARAFPVNGAWALAAADLNADGRPDLAVAASSGQVDLLFNAGDGGFTSTVLTAGASPFYVAIGDLNADARPDVVVVNTGDNTVGVFWNQTTGWSTQLALPVGSGPQWVSIADVNHDGLPDLLVADGSGLGVLLNLGGGAFSGEVSYPSPLSDTWSVAVADFDGDGRADVAVGASDSFGVSSGVVLYHGCP